ncbi:MAG: TlpA family protein disulfide reductase [Dermatophilaceae bacterium]
MRVRSLLGAALAALVVLGACSADPNSVSEQAKAGDRKGYLAGDGTVEQLPAAERGPAVSLSGTTVDGGTWALPADGAGKVVVVNVWGSWCPPCVGEMPTLQKVWSQQQAAGAAVAFVGVAIKESPESSLAFLKATHVTFPSISDRASAGGPMLALQGKAPATPTTLVLDKQGRIAARVSAAVTETTLTALVDDALAS